MFDKPDNHRKVVVPSIPSLVVIAVQAVPYTAPKDGAQSQTIFAIDIADGPNGIGYWPAPSITRISAPLPVLKIELGSQVKLTDLSIGEWSGKDGKHGVRWAAAKAELLK